MREKYESLALLDLKSIAKARGIKGTSIMKKAEVVNAMLELDEKENVQNASKESNLDAAAAVKRENPDYSKAETESVGEGEKVIARKNPADLSELDSGIEASGILEVMPDGFGFIRCENYMPGENDVYVAPSQIRRFNMKTGDIVTGNTRIKKETEKFSALLYVKNINGYAPEVAARRTNFEDMTPIFPDERMRLETPESSVAMRIMDLMSPIGKGQRGMIVAPPRTGKTVMMKNI